MMSATPIIIQAIIKGTNGRAYSTQPLPWQTTPQGRAIRRCLEAAVELAARVELRADLECLELETGRAWRLIKELLCM